MTEARENRDPEASSRSRVSTGCLAVGAVMLALGVVGVVLIARVTVMPLLRQRTAREALEAAGGKLTTERVLAGPGFGSAAVWYVDFSATGLSDAQLTSLVRHLKALGGVRRLNLSGTQVGDVGLSSVADGSHVYVIDVTNARVTPAGIAQARVRGDYPLVVDNTGPRAAPTDGCEDLLFSHDGRLLAVVSRAATDVWDTETSRRMAQAPGGSSVAFSADGKRLAIAGGEGARVLSLETRETQLLLPTAAHSPQGIAFAADGQSLWVGDERFALPTGKPLDRHAGMLLGRSRDGPRVDLPQQVTRMIHPDLGSHSGRITDPMNVVRLGVVNATGTHAAWMPDPATAPSARPVIHVVDLAVGGDVQQIDARSCLLLCGAFDRHATRLVVGGSRLSRSDGIVRAYDVATGRELLSRDDSAGTTVRVAISDNGRQVAAAFEHGSIKWWTVSH